MIDTHDRLPDEVEAVPQEEVVGLVDAPRLGVVHRNEPPAGAADLDRLEHGPDRRERPMLRDGEEREGALLRVRAGLALVRDDVHSAELTTPRNSPIFAAPERG